VTGQKYSLNEGNKQNRTLMRKLLGKWPNGRRILKLKTGK